MTDQPTLFDSAAPAIGTQLFIDGVPRGTVIAISADGTRAHVERRLDDGIQQIWIDLPVLDDLDAAPIPLPRNIGPDPLIAKISDHLHSKGYAEFAIQFLNGSESNFKVIFPHLLDYADRQALAEELQPLLVSTTLSFKNVVKMSIPAAWRQEFAAENAAATAAHLAAEEPPMPADDNTPTQELDPAVIAAIVAQGLPEADFALPGQPSELDDIPMPTADSVWDEFTSQPDYQPPTPAADELKHAQERIAALEESLRLLLAPQPTRKEVKTLRQDLDKASSDAELADHLSHGWEVLHIAVNTTPDRQLEVAGVYDLDICIRIVTLVRDVPAAVSDPTPTVTQASVAVQPSVVIDPLRVAGQFAQRFPMAHELAQRGSDAVLADMDAKAWDDAGRMVEQYRAAFPAPQYTAIPGRL